MDVLDSVVLDSMQVLLLL